MKNLVKHLPLVAGALMFANIVHADTLTLKDGQTITGTLVSRSADGVVFDIAGQQLKFDAADIKGLSFGDMSSAEKVEKAVVAEALAEVTKVANAEKTAVLIAGTTVLIKTNTTINSKQHKTGHKFTARLESDLVSNGVIVAPRGSNVYGVLSQAKQSRRLAGRSSLVIQFTDIMLNNQLVPIKTSPVQAVSDGTAKKTIGKTARMAAIGGLINGSDGAKDGAKVGAGLSLLTSGSSINIPAGTLLEFSLTAPLAKP
jgi:hypothetical protein